MAPHLDAMGKASSGSEMRAVRNPSPYTVRATINHCLQINKDMFMDRYFSMFPFHSEMTFPTARHKWVNGKDKIIFYRQI